MTDFDPPNFQYCPLCGQELTVKQGVEKDRKYCSSCDWTYYPRMAIGVGAVIQEEGQVLLVQRAREPQKGYWQLPAGFVEYGEHPQTTLAREIKEETNLSLQTAQLLSLHQMTDDPREPGHLFIAYQGTVQGKEASTDPDENAQLAWHSLDKLPPMAWQAHQDVLENLNSS